MKIEVDCYIFVSGFFQGIGVFEFFLLDHETSLYFPWKRETQNFVIFRDLLLL